MFWIYLIIQAVILSMLGRRFKDKHDGVYAVTLNVLSLLSFLLGFIMAPLLIKILPFFLIAPSRFFPNMGQSFAWSQQSLAQNAKASLRLFSSIASRHLGSLFHHFEISSQPPEAPRSFTSYSLSGDHVFNWSTLKDILLLLGGSLTAWFSYLSYEIANAFPQNLTKIGERQVS